MTTMTTRWRSSRRPSRRFSASSRRGVISSDPDIDLRHCVLPLGGAAIRDGRRGVLAGPLDCFVAVVLAMTEGVEARLRRE